MILKTAQLLRRVMPAGLHAAKFNDNDTLIEQYLKWKQSHAPRAAKVCVARRGNRGGSGVGILKLIAGE
jgi:hypothetical protein